VAILLAHIKDLEDLSTRAVSAGEKWQSIVKGMKTGLSKIGYECVSAAAMQKVARDYLRRYDV
jgi:hypothetical protein